MPKIVSENTFKLYLIKKFRRNAAKFALNVFLILFRPLFLIELKKSFQLFLKKDNGIMGASIFSSKKAKEKRKIIISIEAIED
jgi:hypothetical protein